MAKKTFKKVVLCHTGDFDDKNEKLRKWVEYRGGRVESDITPDVTHLVASTDAWRRGHTLINKAKRRSHVKIVTFDWLEDSLQSRSATPKETEPYLWATVEGTIGQKRLDRMCVKAEKVKRRCKSGPPKKSRVATKSGKVMHFDRQCEELVQDLNQGRLSGGIIHMTKTSS